MSMKAAQMRTPLMAPEFFSSNKAFFKYFENIVTLEDVTISKDDPQFSKLCFSFSD